jgi:hypothetical protein
MESGYSRERGILGDIGGERRDRVGSYSNVNQGEPDMAQVPEPVAAARLDPYGIFFSFSQVLPVSLPLPPTQVSLPLPPISLSLPCSP